MTSDHIDNFMGDYFLSNLLPSNNRKCTYHCLCHHVCVRACVHVCLRSHVRVYMTGFAKTVHNTYMIVLNFKTCNTYSKMARSAFIRQLFCQPYQAMKGHNRICEATEGH